MQHEYFVADSLSPFHGLRFRCGPAGHRDDQRITRQLAGGAQATIRIDSHCLHLIIGDDTYEERREPGAFVQLLNGVRLCGGACGKVSLGSSDDNEFVCNQCSY